MVVSQDGNSRVWERTTTEDVVNGKAVLKKHHYMKLCDGVNFWDGHQWNESKEDINILPDGSGAEAVQGQLQAFFPSDIYEGVIRLVTADGKILQSRPVGLSYDDGSNTVMIAELTNSVGIVNSNEVIYQNAFTGLAAELNFFLLCRN